MVAESLILMWNNNFQFYSIHQNLKSQILLKVCLDWRLKKENDKKRGGLEYISHYIHSLFGKLQN